MIAKFFRPKNSTLAMDSTSSQKPETNTVVYCGNLSPKVSVAELIALFALVAPIVHIRVLKREGALFSSAFVTFPSLEDAERVVKKCNYHTLHGKQIILNVVDQNKVIPEEANLFVKNLPATVTSMDLNNMFKQFGPLVSCKVSMDENNESRGFGFVQFEDLESAESAIKGLHDTKIGENTLQVTKYDKAFRGVKNGGKAERSTAFTNVFVKNFPSTMTEMKLKEILGKFGAISSIHFPMDGESKPVGFACVNFENSKDAEEAIQNLHGKLGFPAEEYSEETVSPQPFYIQKFENKKDRSEGIKKQLEGMTLGNVQAKSNLYISNIPDAYTKEELMKLFGQFGEITSIRLDTGMPGNKKFGYVCFSKIREASQAYEKLDGTVIDNYKIQISFYKPKIERRAGTTKTRVPREGGYSATVAKLQQELASMVEKSALQYRDDWSVVDASNESEFSQRVGKAFFSLGENKLKEMVASSQALEREVKNILKTKKEKNKKSVN